MNRYNSLYKILFSGRENASDKGGLSFFGRQHSTGMREQEGSMTFVLSLLRTRRLAYWLLSV